MCYSYGADKKSPEEAVLATAAGLVDGRRWFVPDPGCSVSHPTDQRTFHDFVAKDIDERIENDVAVRHQYHEISSRVVRRTTRSLAVQKYRSV